MYTGKIHCDCFKKAHEEKYKKSGLRTKQGFITNDNKFVSREKGAEIAIKSGQIKKLKYSDKELFSEDLW